MKRSPAILLMAVLPLTAMCSWCNKPSQTVVLISADAEWKEVLKLYPDARLKSTPYGAYLDSTAARFFHGGWGKIAAAASTQYAIDEWHPRLLLNLGTCGGFQGQVSKGDIIFVTRTVTYDIIEQMGDSTEAIQDYSTDLDEKLLPPQLAGAVRKSVLVSADRDIIPSQIPELRKKYRAIAADWESSAIAYVAKRNKTPLMILRGVSDVVGPAGAETYGNLANFQSGTELIMVKLNKMLPMLIGDR